MPCLNPILVGPEGEKAMVRCGKCRPCLIRRKQAWVGRLILERQDHVAARFLTLTYGSAADREAELNTEHIQKFMKRYRYHYGPCRFYAVGEYGEKSGHAHWHAIIFGHNQEAQGHWENQAWPLGFAYDGSVTTHSIGYVAKYATKRMPRGRRNVSRMSLKPGIGLGRISKLAEMVAASLHSTRLGSWPGRFSIDGKSYPLMEGALIAFQNSFIDAGGFAPLSLNPEDRHVVAMEQFADLGSRRRSLQVANNQFMSERGNGLKVPSEKL